VASVDAEPAGLRHRFGLATDCRVLDC